MTILLFHWAKSGKLSEGEASSWAQILPCLAKYRGRVKIYPFKNAITLQTCAAISMVDPGAGGPDSLIREVKVQSAAIDHIIKARTILGEFKTKGDDLFILNAVFEELREALVNLNSLDDLIPDDPMMIH